MKTLIIMLALLPSLVFAADKPSMTALWLDLGFLVIMMISLKIAGFSIKQKAIIFISYVLSGIITKTIWVPVIIWIVLYYIFHNNTDDSTF